MAGAGNFKAFFLRLRIFLEEELDLYSLVEIQTDAGSSDMY